MKSSFLKLTGCLLSGIFLATSCHAGMASASANKVLVSTLESKKPYLDYCFELLKMYYQSSGVEPAPQTIDLKINGNDGIASVANVQGMRCAMVFDKKETTSAILRDKVIAEACRPAGGNDLFNCNSTVVLSNIVLTNHLKSSPSVGDPMPILAQAGYAHPIFSNTPLKQALGNN